MNTEFVYVAHAVTESLDHYYYAFEKEPTREQIIERVWKSEGECADLEFYRDNCTVKIVKRKVE